MCKYDNLFLAQLERRESPGEALLIPDGLCDLSNVIEPLFVITNEGRPFNSSEQNFAINFFARTLTGSTCVITRYVVLAKLIHAINSASPHSLAEEVFSYAFSQDRIRTLAAEWAATPYVQDGDGNLVPLFFVHRTFTRTHRPSFHQLKGFTIRHWLPTLDNEVDHRDSRDITNPVDSSGQIRWISISDFEQEELEADPYNGYEDIFDFFFDNVLTPLEELNSLEDLGYSDDEIEQYKSPDEWDEE